LLLDIFGMTFTIRASKDGETIETVRIGPTASVAKARGLFKTGWMVQIIDSEGLCYAPSEFDQLLSFGRHKAAKDTPKDDVLAVLEISSPTVAAVSRSSAAPSCPRSKWGSGTAHGCAGT
jgi:hypothetical protein